MLLWTWTWTWNDTRNLGFVKKVSRADSGFLNGGGGGTKDCVPKAHIMSAKHKVPYSRGPGLA